ncbi:hypothetical protein F5Y17DRAFT_465463 [Xylariaceae sp. FL0594]|nr:hypothetical protein F5Y17DRAFT_465463 [Xylariaceae sp. FL0594]
MPPLHQHQLSLEAILDFSPTERLSIIQRADAERRFYRIVNHFLPDSEIDSSAPSQTYSPPRLISLTYQYALSDEARDNFLRAFFLAVDLPIVRNGTGDDGDPEALRSSVFAFADYLMDQFFLPLKASTKKTPQPSPIFHSAIEKVQGGPRSFAGTQDRLSALRGACLIRDHHRCVISHSFDTHIIPHSLMKVGQNDELSPSKKAVLAIINMFDTEVVHLIEAGDIDRPRNALTLTQPFHVYFGETIDPPSARLLALHRAIAHILHFSAAAEYIDELLRKMEGQGVCASDGSTEIDRLLSLALRGWSVSTETILIFQGGKGLSLNPRE